MELGLGESMATDLAALPDDCQERIRQTVRRLIVTYAAMTGTTLPSEQLAAVLPFPRN